MGMGSSSQDLAVFCQADCQSVEESRKTDRKTWTQRICYFCWMEDGRHRSWLAACCRLESAKRLQRKGAEQERTKW